MAVDVAIDSGLAVGTPAALFDAAVVDFDVSADDGRILTIEAESAERESQIHVVLNWFSELQARVPTGR